MVIFHNFTIMVIGDLYFYSNGDFSYFYNNGDFS